jgi:hypothetical protein
MNFDGNFTITVSDSNGRGLVVANSNTGTSSYLQNLTGSGTQVSVPLNIRPSSGQTYPRNT